MNEELKVIITAEIDKFKKGVETAKNQISDFKERVVKESHNVDGYISKMGSGISRAMKGAGVAIAAGAAALVGASAATTEYRNNMAKLETAFNAAGASSKLAERTYNDLYRVLGDSDVAVEAANHLAKLTTNQRELRDWTDICKGVYATFGDSLPIEGLTEAANETAKVGTLTGSLADALNWAGVNEEAFQAKLDACNTESEREKLIRETLNGLYSDAASKYEQNNAQILAQNEAQAKLQSNLAAIGEAIQPVITAFTNFGSNVLAIITPYIQQLAETFIPLLTDALNTASLYLGIVMGYLVNNWETVLAVAGVIGGITAAIGLYNAVAAVKAAMAAAEVATVWGLVAAYAAQAVAVAAAMLPYIAIVAAIAAVIAIIVLCVKHWDEIKETVAKVWEAIKKKTVEIVEKVVAKIKERVEKVVKWFSDLKDKVADKAEQLKEKAASIFGSIKDKISEKISEAKDKAVSSFENLRSNIVSKITSAKDTASNIFNTLKSNLTSKITSAKDSILGVFDKIKSGMKDKINAAKDAVGSVINTIKGFFNFKFEMPHIPKPSFAISPSGWKIGDLLKGSIPKLSIKWNALGGVFDKPTLFGYGNSLQGIGENGAEAVIPLERNTKALDMIAQKMVDRMGLNTPIVLNVDGKVFAQTSINSINQLTRQTGSLGLNLV